MSFRNYKISIIFFVFSLILVSSFILVEILFFSNENKKIELENALNIAKRREATVLSFLESSSNTLNSIKKSNDFSTYINTDGEATSCENLFLTLVNSQQNIMQLRYINVHGQEKIRINRARNHSVYLVGKNV